MAILKIAFLHSVGEQGKEQKLKSNSKFSSHAAPFPLNHYPSGLSWRVLHPDPHKQRGPRYGARYWGNVPHPLDWPVCSSVACESPSQPWASPGPALGPEEPCAPPSPHLPGFSLLNTSEGEREGQKRQVPRKSADDV